MPGPVTVDMLLALLFTAATWQPAPIPPAVPLIDDEGLRGWAAGRAATDCLRNTSGTITFGACAGWLRTESIVAGDFTIAFELRKSGNPGRVALALLGASDARGRPLAAVVVPLFGRFDSDLRLSEVERLSANISATEQALKPANEWQSYVVTRNRTGVHVLLNGTQVLSSAVVRESDGWIGFFADGDGLELRRLTLRRLAPLEGTGTGVPPGLDGVLVDGAYTPGGGVTLPTLVREVRPNYTREALAARIQGTVVIDCVVETDGTVNRAVIVRSLDARLGLDEKALKAVRAWRFRPGTRQGVPVPVRVRVELAFIVKP